MKARTGLIGASVQGRINHVRFADTWGLFRHMLGETLPYHDPDSEL